VVGTNPNFYAEEVISSKSFGNFFDIRGIFPISLGSLERKLKRKKNSLIESRCFRSDNLDCECDAQTIYHSSAVDGTGVAAESENLSQKQICRQNPAIECNKNFVNGTICLTSETNPKSLADFISIEGDSRSLEKYMNDLYSSSEVVYSNFKMPASYLTFPSNSNDYAHASSVGVETREFILMHEGNVMYVGMINVKRNVFNQIDYSVVELKRTLKQEFELLLNRGRLFYTKSGLFGINISSSYQFGREVFKLAPAAQPPVVKSNPSFTT
jgi:hypothetical protein